jgi:hypothetical protein
MRLQLAFLIALGGVASAQTEFVAKTQLYVDNDHTTVVSPLVHAEADVTPTLHVVGNYVADVVTSASVDIVTQASKTTIHDLRQEGTFGANKTIGSWTVGGDYIYSHENDYQSHNFDLSVTRKLADNDTTLGAAGHVSLDAVGRSGDVNYHKSLTTASVDLTWTQVWTPKLVAQLTFHHETDEGFQSSPYRFVPIYADAGMSGPPMFWLPESDPTSRNREAIGLVASQHVGKDSALQGEYRFYFDDWGVLSHTIGATWLVDVSPRLELRFRERFYTQLSALFYRAVYTGPEKYMAMDRELSNLWTELAGVKATYKLRSDIAAEFKVDGFYYRYLDFPNLPSRWGANVGVGIDVTY